MTRGAAGQIKTFVDLVLGVLHGLADADVE
jgi:hypothetical protein